jgi:hypothetical protein
MLQCKSGIINDADEYSERSRLRSKGGGYYIILYWCYISGLCEVMNTLASMTFSFLVTTSTKGLESSMSTVVMPGFLCFPLQACGLRPTGVLARNRVGGGFQRHQGCV